MNAMIDFNRPQLKFALETVRETSKLVREIQENMVTDALTKGDRSPVTVADYAAQALVGQRLQMLTPEDPLIGEEDSSALQNPDERETLLRITEFVRKFEDSASPEKVCRWIDRGSTEKATRFWTVDPIDGTKGFLRGDQYAVALALVVEGQVQIGALGCPNLSVENLLAPVGVGSKRISQPVSEANRGAIVIAVRGEGTWMTSMNGKGSFTRMHVSSQANPSRARLLRSFESGHTNTGQIGKLVEFLEIEAEPVRMDSQAKYAVLAAGHGEALVRLLSPRAPDYREKIWDQAAGSLVVEEAGGKISDLDGRSLDFTAGRTLANNRGILATNGALQNTFLEALRVIGV